MQETATDKDIIDNILNTIKLSITNDLELVDDKPPDNNESTYNYYDNDNPIEYIIYEWGVEKALTGERVNPIIDERARNIMNDLTIRKKWIKQGLAKWYVTNGPLFEKETITSFVNSYYDWLLNEVYWFCRDIVKHYDHLKLHPVDFVRRRKLNSARELIAEKVETIQQPPNRYHSRFLKLEEISDLNDDDKEMIWNEYQQKWYEIHGQQPAKQTKQPSTVSQKPLNKQPPKPKQSKQHAKLSKQSSTVSQPPKPKQSKQHAKQTKQSSTFSQKPLNKQPSRSTRRVKPISDSEKLNNKLSQYVVMHANIDKQPLTIDAFKNYLNGWATVLNIPTPDTLDSNWYDLWYEAYINKYYNQPTTHIHIPTQQLTNTIAFKTANKVNALLQKYPDKQQLSQTQTSYFPLKQNIKQYQLHKVSKPHSYLIDLMFVDKLCYLVAINVNTRYLFVGLMNHILFNDNDNDEQRFSKASKDTTTYLKTLSKLIEVGMDVKYLTGDGESAFASREAQQFYKEHDIIFTPAPRVKMGNYPDFMKREQQHVKTDPMHSSLGMIDRVIRTLRDMAYNMKIGIITPQVMKDLVNQYNNAPHCTLSRYIGMDITPQMVQDDPELESYITRQIAKNNYNIINKPGFILPAGTQVKLYNEHDSLMKRRSIIQPGTYHIVGFDNGLYRVANDKNNEQLVPRYKIDIAL